MVFVEDDGSTKTTGRVDASSGDGDGSQVNQEHSESNGEWGQNLQIDTLVSQNRVLIIAARHEAVTYHDHTTTEESNLVPNFQIQDPIKTKYSTYSNMKLISRIKRVQQ